MDPPGREGGENDDDDDDDENDADPRNMGSFANILSSLMGGPSVSCVCDSNCLRSAIYLLQFC